MQSVLATRSLKLIVIAALLATALLATAPTALGKARVIKTLGPADGTKDDPVFAAVDTKRNKIYFTNLGGDDGLGSAADHLTVIDGKTDKIVATVVVGDHPSGVAVDQKSGLVYVANTSGKPPVVGALGTDGRFSFLGGGGGTISVVDPKTNTVTETIDVPPPPGAHFPNLVTPPAPPAPNITGQPSVNGWPGGLAVDSETGLLYVANAGETAGGRNADCCYTPGKLSIYDPEKKTWIKGGADGIPAGISPIEPVINERTNRVYVASIDTHDITVVNTKTRRVVDRIKTLPEPYGLALDERRNRVYVGHFDQRAVSDPTVNCPTCPETLLPYRTVLEILNSKKGKFQRPIYGGSFTRNVAVDPRTGRIYIANLVTSSVTIVKNGKVIQRVKVGPGPRGIAVNPLTNKIYVGNTAASAEGGNIDLPDGKPDSISVIRDRPPRSSCRRKGRRADEAGCKRDRRSGRDDG